MLKRTFSILLAIALQCLLPFAHAENTDTQSHTHTHTTDSSFDVKTNILYTGENAGGFLLPHFLGDPGFGGKIGIAYSTDDTDYSVGLKSVYSNFQNGQSGLTGHTGLSVGVGTEIGIAYLSARQSYMHTVTDSNDFFLHDIYETLLKAELANGTQKPYIFTGLVIPAYVPVEKVVGMGGFGLMNHIPVYSGVGWDTGIHADTSIATSLFNINREEETVVRSRIALQAQAKGSPLEIGLGFNIFQDLRRTEHKIWWDFGFSYLF